MTKSDRHIVEAYDKLREAISRSFNDDLDEEYFKDWVALELQKKLDKMFYERFGGWSPYDLLKLLGYIHGQTAEAVHGRKTKEKKSRAKGKNKKTKKSKKTIS